MAHTRSVSRLRAAAAGAVLAVVLSSTTACTSASSTPSGTPATSPARTNTPAASPSASRAPTAPPSTASPRAGSTTGPRTPRASARPAAQVTAGHSAWVSVAVARLWESPTSPRSVDAPAVASPVRFREWLGAMTLTQRRDLSSYSDTEALMGERVLVRRVTRDWASVVVPDQPSQKDPGGYPGWVPVRQLTGSAPARAALVATVVRPTTWLLSDTSPISRDIEISSGTSLPVLTREGRYLRVRTPLGTVRRMYAGDGVVHRPGTAALPPHRGVLATAEKYLGLAYLWGGLSGFGIDCSGLTWLSDLLHGTLIPRDALPQSQHGTPVPRSGLAPGDLIFYATNGLVHHVTMYAGSGEMIEAPHTGAVARVVPVRSVEYYGARRY